MSTPAVTNRHHYWRPLHHQCWKPHLLDDFCLRLTSRVEKFVDNPATVYGDIQQPWKRSASFAFVPVRDSMKRRIRGRLSFTKLEIVLRAMSSAKSNLQNSSRVAAAAVQITEGITAKAMTEREGWDHCGTCPAHGEGHPIRENRARLSDELGSGLFRRRLADFIEHSDGHFPVRASSRRREVEAGVAVGVEHAAFGDDGRAFTIDLDAAALEHQ